ncbi:MAG: hypothetical protein ACTSUF_00010 [Candidatus Heimdallarchaeaceae archaeon]
MVSSEFIISLSITIFMFLLGVIFIIQSVLMHRTAYTLTFGIFIGATASLIETIRSFKSYSYDDVLLVLALSVWVAAYFLMFVFFQQLAREGFNSLLLSLVILFGTFHIFNGIIKLSSEQMSAHLSNIFVFLWDLGYGLIGITVFAYGTFVHFDLYRKTKEIAGIITSGALLLLTLGFVVALLGDFSAFLTSEDIIEKNFMSFGFPLGDILKLLGLATFVIFYIVNLRYIFRLPVNISTIMIFNNLGMLIYAAKYSHESAEESEKALPIELITASINAFETFMRQTTQSKEPLKRIETYDKNVIIESSHLASIAVIADKSTYFLINSMKKLIKAIELNFAEHLEKSFTDSQFYQDVPNYIGKYFPYLGLPTAESY